MPASKTESTLANCLDNYPKGARKLIITAEKLFAQYGIDNVSLRQIVASAGQSNNYAVQHHFGSKEGLIEAIFTARTAILDTARQKRLEALQASDNQSLESIISAIMLPILDAFNEKDRDVFSDFMFHLLHRNKIMAKGFMNGNMVFYEDFAPAVSTLNKMLQESLAHLPKDVFILRYRLAAELFLSGLNERKRLNINSDALANIDSFHQEILSLTTAVFKAPFNAA